MAERNEIVEYPDSTEERIVDCEKLDMYRPGGFCPIDFGDTLEDGRFEVVYKLGYGGFGTVWLCWDNDVTGWKAIKVPIALPEGEYPGDVDFAKLMRTLDVDAKKAAAHHVLLPVEFFIHESSNGIHTCIVFPVMGPYLRWRGWRLQEDGSTRKICRQLVEGMDFLHSMGICHGDFRPENVLMKLKGNGFDGITKKDMVRMLDANRKWPTYKELYPHENRTRSKHAPRYVYSTMNDEDWYIMREHMADDIIIADFGESYAPSQPPRGSAIPHAYRSPEGYFGGHKLNFGHDIWALACTLVDVTIGGIHIAGHDNVRSHVRRMERFIGPMPDPYRDRVLGRLYDYDIDVWRLNDRKGPIPSSRRPADGEPVSGSLEPRGRFEVDDQYTDPLEVAMGRPISIPDVETQIKPETGRKHHVITWKHFRMQRDQVFLFCDLLRQMVRWHPNERMRTGEVLKHPWLQVEPTYVPLVPAAPAQLAMPDDEGQDESFETVPLSPEPEVETGKSSSPYLPPAQVKNKKSSPPTQFEKKKSSPPLPPQVGIKQPTSSDTNDVPSGLLIEEPETQDQDAFTDFLDWIRQVRTKWPILVYLLLWLPGAAITTGWWMAVVFGPNSRVHVSLQPRSSSRRW